VIVLVDSNKESISIPRELAEKLKQRAGSARFDSLSDYVVYILEQVLANIETEEKDKAISKEDEEKVKARLREMGYLEDE